MAAALAFIYLRDVPVKANFKQQLDIFSNPNTWYMTILYVMTFGLFSGFSAVFALLINNQFGGDSTLGLPVLGATFAFLGPLIGSIIRMSWGIFCDRMGGAIWTFISGVGMAITLAGIAWVLYNPTGWNDFYIFMALMLTMFLFSGFGNAGTFQADADDHAGPPGRRRHRLHLRHRIPRPLPRRRRPLRGRHRRRMGLLPGMRHLLRPVLGPVLGHVRAQERPVPRLIHPALRGADGPATASSIDS